MTPRARRRFATATSMVAVGALGLHAAAAVARQHQRAAPSLPRAGRDTLTALPPTPPAAPRTTWQPPPPEHLTRRRRRQGLTATIVAALLALSGMALIAVVVASQQQAPAPPALTVAAAESVQAATAAPTSASQRPAAWRRTMGAGWPAANLAEEGSPAQDSVAAATAGDSGGAAEAPMAPSKPVSIDIPAIDVHSVLRHLGQAPNGSLEVPSGAQYNDAAWYRHSPPPGALGPAVILGHVDSAAQGPSVFFRLGELQRGNRVAVTRADGSVAVFAVTAVRRYAKDRFPTQVVYSDIDHAGLRILTCGGAFDDAAGSYLDNIVVFAELVEA